MDDLFPGFESHWIDTDHGRIFARSGGQGPPLLLLHGFPQTHAMWHRLAPALAARNRVVAMDLRGYGWSCAPRSKGGALYTKRAMGEDAVRVMEALGHATFALAGHDRGARVGYRLSLDQPGRVTRLALLDILPTFHVWREMEAGRVPAAHWGFLAGAEPEPEERIGQDPLPYFEGLLAQWSGSGLGVFDPGALALYRASCNEPTRIHAFCEDYRAGATFDRAADEEDLREGRSIACPTLLVWGGFYLTGRGGDPLAVWRGGLAPRAEGVEVEGGHFVAEEDPAGVLRALLPFLA